MKRKEGKKSKPATYQRLQNKTEKRESVSLPSTTACGLRFPFRGVMAAAVTALERSWSCLQQGEKIPSLQQMAFTSIRFASSRCSERRKPFAKSLGHWFVPLQFLVIFSGQFPVPTPSPFSPHPNWPRRQGTSACPSPVHFKSHTFKHSHLPPSTRPAGRQFPCLGWSTHTQERKTG